MRNQNFLSVFWREIREKESERESERERERERERVRKNLPRKCSKNPQIIIIIIIINSSRGSGGIYAEEKKMTLSCRRTLKNRQAAPMAL